MGTGAFRFLPLILKLPRMAWMRKTIRLLREISHFVVLLALAIAQVVIAHLSWVENNKGVNYAAFFGALFTLIQKLAVAVDKAEHLHVSTCRQGLIGTYALGFLPNLVKLPIVLVNFVFDCAEGAVVSIPDSVRWLRTTLKYAVVVTWLTVGVVGLTLIPVMCLLLIVDMVSIPVLETIFVLCAENLWFTPQLDGIAWAYSTLALAITATLSHIANDYLTWISFKVLDLCLHSNIKLSAADLLKLIRLVPETCEDAVASSLNNMKRSEPEMLASAPLYHVCLSKDHGSDVLKYGIIFSLDYDMHNWHNLNRTPGFPYMCNIEISSARNVKDYWDSESGTIDDSSTDEISRD